MNIEFIVDIQGFEIPQFIAKEVAVMSRDGKKLTHFIVKPPFPWSSLTCKSKKNVLFLIEKHHGLLWDEGFVEYEDMRKYLSEIYRSASKIIVKGDLNKKFVKEYFDGEIVNLENKLLVK